jgi:hypothetical protein
MPVYRCFFHDGDNNVLWMVRADHPDDALAIAWAADLRQQTDHRQCEIWQGKRLVMVIRKP